MRNSQKKTRLELEATPFARGGQSYISTSQLFKYERLLLLKVFTVSTGGVGSISHLQLCSWCYNWCMKFIPPVLGC